MGEWSFSYPLFPAKSYRYLNFLVLPVKVKEDGLTSLSECSAVKTRTRPGLEALRTIDAEADEETVVQLCPQLNSIIVPSPHKGPVY